MEIKTKFDIKEEIYCMCANMPIKAIISSINVNIDDAIKVDYYVKDLTGKISDKHLITVSENNIFRSKSELIKHLMEE